MMEVVCIALVVLNVVQAIVGLIERERLIAALEGKEIKSGGKPPKAIKPKCIKNIERQRGEGDTR